MNSYSTSWWSLLLINRSREDERLELALLADLQRMAYPFKWSVISCRYGADQWKFAGQRLTFYHWATQPTMQPLTCALSIVDAVFYDMIGRDICALSIVEAVFYDMIVLLPLQRCFASRYKIDVFRRRRRRRVVSTLPCSRIRCRHHGSSMVTVRHQATATLADLVTMLCHSTTELRPTAMIRQSQTLRRTLALTLAPAWVVEVLLVVVVVVVVIAFLHHGEIGHGMSA